MTTAQLLELVRKNKGKAHEQARLPQRTSRFRCPAYQGRCSQRCFLRHVCTTRPAELMDLVHRLDPQTAEALNKIVNRLYH